MANDTRTAKTLPPPADLGRDIARSAAEKRAMAYRLLAEAAALDGAAGLPARRKADVDGWKSYSGMKVVKLDIGHSSYTLTGNEAATLVSDIALELI